MSGRGFVVAVLGAESTGKTTLCGELGALLSAEGRDAVVVGEYLREFCDRHARTPRRDEQAAIAAEQTRRIDAAAVQHAIVIADTTALMIAVYSDQVFGDRSLYASAEHAQRRRVLGDRRGRRDAPGGRALGGGTHARPEAGERSG